MDAALAVLQGLVGDIGDRELLEQVLLEVFSNRNDSRIAEGTGNPAPDRLLLSLPCVAEQKLKGSSPLVVVLQMFQPG